ncbi:hypothetical protein BTK96_006580 [Burkholderia pyrrocinia]|uniref:hypothetical protein n=1 Tax=Burkholderia sp. IT-111MI5 TaxID=3026439 RepID=UPI002A2A9F43|nr:hypothetical protein [Burkholderia pyrrocinia]EKS9897133.1 hypothetical protein [Burkholderia pyrrocinia]EKS9909883.1 hypothetical protein [Burkholderia pyrrocinia]
MKTKFKGSLGKPIFVKPPSLFEFVDSEEAARRKYSESISVARTEKLPLLFKHYGVQQGDFVALAMSMAVDLIPGFQVETEVKRAGPKTKWDDVARGYLAVELERQRQRNPRQSIKAAAGHLAKREPWKSYVSGADPAERLRQEYENAKNARWTKVCRDAFRYHEATGTVSEWDETILKLGT